MLGSRPLYIYILIAAFLGIVFPLIVRKLSRPLFSGKVSVPTPHVSHGNLGSRINVRFFLGMLVAGFLTALILILMPVLIYLRQMPDRSSGLVTTLAVLGFTFIGLLYAVRKADLSWGRSLMPSETHPQARNEP